MPDQLTFFSEPRARQRDPDTSHEAAASIKPHAEALERHILERFGISRRLTHEQLCSFLPGRNPGSVTTACGRLKNLGYIAPTATREKNSGGRNVIVWRITPAGYERLGWSM